MVRRGCPGVRPEGFDVKQEKLSLGSWPLTLPKQSKVRTPDTVWMPSSSMILHTTKKGSSIEVNAKLGHYKASSLGHFGCFDTLSSAVAWVELIECKR
jgi:hypothetical protein